MTTLALEPFRATLDDSGVSAGPIRRPDNISKAALGSIHDDATAHKLGFRGGTVAANTHYDQFSPLMIAAFGEDWLKTGGLSLYFLNATTDGEPVQAFVGPKVPREGGGFRAEVWMETPQGVRVCEGDGYVGGPDADSALRRRLKDVRPPGELRLLKASQVGDVVRDLPVNIDWTRAEGRLAPITEPLAAYRDATIYGARVLQPALVIDAMRVVEPELFRPKSAYVGMFGAIEVQHLGGPVFVDHDYLVDGTVVALSDSPKTEVTWYESTMRDAADNRPVARMILMSRLLKASSTLWG